MRSWSAGSALTAVKRQDHLLTTLAALRDRGVDALLLLVGDRADRARLEQRAHELGVARFCVFLDYQEDVAPWYAVCDAVALTSVSEGTPATIIEALPAGRAVVATSVGGVRRCKRRRTGYLVPPGDIEALAERLASWPRIQSAATPWGARDASACSAGMRSSGWSTTSTSSTAGCFGDHLCEPPVAVERDLAVPSRWTHARPRCPSPQGTADPRPRPGSPSRPARACRAGRRCRSRPRDEAHRLAVCVRRDERARRRRDS